MTLPSRGYSPAQPSTGMPEEKLKVVVVGDGAVGKTSICHVFVNKTFPDTYEPTVFENHTVKIDISGKVILTDLMKL